MAQSAVIGRTTQGNEEILAFVQPSSNSHLTVTDLVDYAAKHLAAYKRPTEFLLVSTMPMTASGKVAKNDLATRTEDMRRNANCLKAGPALESTVHRS